MNEQKSPNNNAPFKTLGTHLKYLREQLSESLHEASGAVEIDADSLQRIEQGTERPSEDILLLLIQHYNMQDQEAVQLWELAGYEGEASQHKFRIEDVTNAANNKQMVMLLAMDMRTMYSDGLDVNIDHAGLTLNFTQTGANNQRMPVGRIGMSYDQAAHVLKTLEEAMLKAKYMNRPHGLPSPKDQTENLQG